MVFHIMINFWMLGKALMERKEELELTDYEKNAKEAFIYDFMK